MAFTNLTTDHAASAPARLRQIVEGIRNMLKQRSEYRRTYRALQSLTDRELADIGLRRCDIASVARCNASGR
ncbi:DUF1127 domain-containing protein [Phycobacter azelaicus]|uniref:DUF1127 domain-containing protein n=1 Tax=Phycobacter azelaicus TaxID=2668075 RepID=UPI0018668399|nr:DUF1127 domain-containing protein [Phycobacter azelaicus]MBE1297618.1 DUF1127 domain-containing protein [Paracoccaceae bacterium]